MPEPRLRFPKTARLARAGEFARVKAEGKPYHGRYMLLSILAGLGPDSARVGFITSRRVGGAVVRNRVRRRLREIVRAARPRLIAGVWLVIIARSHAAGATFAALEAEWLHLARRGAILEALPCDL